MKQDGKIEPRLLRRLRANRELSRREVAQGAGVSLQTVARLELSLHSVPTTTDTLVQLANFFHVPCGYLLGESFASIDGFGLSDELRKVLEKFITKLRGLGNNPIETLGKLALLLETNKVELTSEANISLEEEILGLWWSVVSAYQQGDWAMMITKSERLINIAESLGRMYLAAIGHAYKAKALRNKGGEGFLKSSEGELRDILATETYQSGLTCRMIGKVYSREGKHDEAMREYKKAEKFVSESKRSDALFFLEKTKLLRNIARSHDRLAVVAKEKGDKTGRDYHLNEAERYIVLCEESIKDLGKQIKREAEIEKMLLARCRAYHLELLGKLRAAIEEAEAALKKANDLGEKDYAARIRMILFHVLMELDDKERAMYYFGSLFPLERYSRGRFAYHFERQVGPHILAIMEYIKEQQSPSRGSDEAGKEKN